MIVHYIMADTFSIGNDGYVACIAILRLDTCVYIAGCSVDVLYMLCRCSVSIKIQNIYIRYISNLHKTMQYPP